MNEGKRFEEAFKKSVPKDVYCERFPDAAVGFRINKKDKEIRFAPKSPYDFILYRWPELYCVELKTTDKTNFSFVGKSANIKEFQINKLIKVSQYANAGFFLNFRKTGNTYFLKINDFCKIRAAANKVSINEKDIEGYAIKIPHRLLKSNYRYDLSPLFPQNGIDEKQKDVCRQQKLSLQEPQ